jgi:non-homologous end joining protein Ku
MGTLRKDVSIRLGLITLPVSVQSAVSEDKDSKLTTVCTNDHDPVKIKQTTACPACSLEGSIYSFPKGKDNGDGTFTVLTKEQVDAAYAEGVSEDVKNTISLTAHPAADVAEQTLPGEKMYYLAPGKTAGEAYPMLVQLIKTRPDIALCTVFAVRSAPAMYRLAVFNDRLALHQIAWPDVVNEAPALRQDDFNPALLPMAAQFVDALMMPFDASTYRDTRKDKLNQFLETAEATTAGVEPATADTPTESPLLTLLRAAVEPVTEVPKPRTARKTVAKAPAKPRATKVTPIKEKVSA